MSMNHGLHFGPASVAVAFLARRLAVLFSHLSRVVLFSLAFASVMFVRADEPTTAQKAAELEYFEREVRPLLVSRCNECHSKETGPDNGGLVLESPEGIAAGGSRGQLLQPGNPESSLLIEAVRYQNVELQMPPDGKLPDQELAVLENWVARGAIMPDPAESSVVKDTKQGVDWQAAREFWSFRPLAPVALPRTHATSGLAPIDAFIAARREAAGLPANPPAPRDAWIRRVTFDCLGLPPTPAEVEAFVRDASPQAYERVVDRLLASPRYGERWGRTWLDLARYTDATPFWQSPTDRGWLYRDWVIRALNENRPYDDFVRAQLAADRLPGMRPTDLAALGFLGLSPTYWKELRLAPGVIQQIVADEWDERIDTVTRTFLGLTVACARCHDHKFDPITTEDYYALAGVFASSQIDERPLLPDCEASLAAAMRSKRLALEDRLKKLREEREKLAQAKRDATPATAVVTLATVNAETEDTANPEPIADAATNATTNTVTQVSHTEEVSAEALMEQEIAGLEQQVVALHQSAPDRDQPWAHTLREASIYVEPDGDEMTKLVYREGEPRDLPVYRRGNPLNPGDIVPRRFLRLFASQESPRAFRAGSGRAELADAIVVDAQGLAARVVVNRLWDHHFQAGLVRTTSDFGTQGERPSHPELLDYLAYELVHHAWDLKWLHREILLSATYRQSSAYAAEGYQFDPDNRLLWRMNRRRLEIEMWRDATLAVTGQLDLRMYGPSAPVDALNNFRRSIYATVEREDLHPMLRMHDFPEASSHSPRRTPTVTPLQQLFVLNSPWLEEQSKRLHQRLLNVPEQERLDEAYRLLFSRTPTPAERERAEAYLQHGVDHGGHASDVEKVTRWQDLLQALLGINEFHFVD